MEYTNVKCVKSFYTKNVLIESGTDWFLVNASFTVKDEGQVKLSDNDKVILYLDEKLFKEHFALIERNL